MDTRYLREGKKDAMDIVTDLPGWSSLGDYEPLCNQIFAKVNGHHEKLSIGHQVLSCASNER